MGLRLGLVVCMPPGEVDGVDGAIGLRLGLAACVPTGAAAPGWLAGLWGGRRLRVRAEALSIETTRCDLAGSREAVGENTCALCARWPAWAGSARR